MCLFSPRSACSFDSNATMASPVRRPTAFKPKTIPPLEIDREREREREREIEGTMFILIHVKLDSWLVAIRKMNVSSCIHSVSHC